MATNYKKYLPIKGSSTINILLVVVGLFFLYKIFLTFKDLGKNWKENLAGKNELEQLNSNSSTKQTLTKQQAISFANSLFTALDGYGTDETGIFSVFYKLKNNADFLAVSNAFGTREISSGSWNPEANFKGTLAPALRSELDASYILKLNSILSQKNIKYKI